MALLFMDGFDKYGGVNSNNAGVLALLTAGEWTTGSTTALSIAASLSATGQALSIVYNSATPQLTKTLPASYSRLIGGVRFNVAALGVSNSGVGFQDAGTTQCCVTINASTGTISLRNGASGGTALATSSTSVSVGTTHYLEWDITFGNSAAYQVWLNGASLFSGTGDTTTTANNTANAFMFNGSTTGSTIAWDDLYLFDTTGSTNNAVLLTSPRIETQFPTSDGAVQFAVGAGILGSSVSRTTTNGTVALGSLVLRRFVPTVSCTLNSVGIAPIATNASVQLRGVVYADSSGAAGTLMSSGSTVTGITSGTAAVLPLTTPQSLLAGTPYWLGFMNDLVLSSSLSVVDSGLLGYRAAATFGSGAPGTAPAMTIAQPSYTLWGNLTGITGNNWYEVSQQPPVGANSYLFDATIGHEDLYGFGPLSAPPANIYSVAVKANVAKSDTGAKTFSVRMKSVAADSPGSIASITPGTSYSWATSLFPVDPNTSAAWTNAALAAATAGVKVET